MLYVYGIVASRRFEAIPSEGHDGSDVVTIPYGPVAAAVSFLPPSTIAASPQNVLRHERVLKRLMQAHAVLPLRFGATCRSVDALGDVLLCSSDELTRDLERLRGKVEMALRIVDGLDEQPGRNRESHHAAPAEGTDGPGAAYLRARSQQRHDEMAREDSAKRLAEKLRQDFGSVLNDVHCAASTGSSPGFLVSCLVERDQVAAFAKVLDRFRGEYPHIDVTCTGPWAPYSFVAKAPVFKRQG